MPEGKGGNPLLGRPVVPWKFCSAAEAQLGSSVAADANVDGYADAAPLAATTGNAPKAAAVALPTSWAPDGTAAAADAASVAENSADGDEVADGATIQPLVAMGGAG